MSKFKVSTTTWTPKSKSFILYIEFFSAPSSAPVAQFVNNIECEQKAIIAK